MTDIERDEWMVDNASPLPLKNLTSTSLVMTSA